MLKQLNLSNVQHTLSTTSPSADAEINQNKILNLLENLAIKNSKKCMNKQSKIIDLKENSPEKANTIIKSNIRKFKELEKFKLNKFKELKKRKLTKFKELKKIKLKKIKEVEKYRLKKLIDLEKRKLKKFKELEKCELKKSKELEKCRLKKVIELEKIKLKKAKDLKIIKKKKLRELAEKKKLDKIKLKNLIKIKRFKKYLELKKNKIKSDPSIPTEPKSARNVIKIMSKKWKLMSESEKLEYEQKMKLLKHSYTAELHKWWDNVDKNLVKLENRRRRVINKIRKANGICKLSLLVDPREPTRPSTAYYLFVKDIKESNNQELAARYIDFSKYTSAKWKELPESEKDIYRNKFTSAFKLYKEALNKFQSGQIQNNI
ncbi:hypothetical protein BB561_005681 [Smittium simulii]|uniref:HMG box domain-containing protein n=1 Tax=Smittium simulii TaxID=133385 RepID=A0A2T9Y912_9FUNG|nr:hypothetical protein BB561_005681 [Smittium simulii]